MEQALSERYAAPPVWRRRVTLAGVAVLAVVSLAWLAWAAIYQATPQVESAVLGWDIKGPHAVQVSVRVDIHDPGSHPTCTVQALADDHTIVGDLTFTPTTSGTTVVTVKTQRDATSVTSPGCTADGQDEPR